MNKFDKHISLVGVSFALGSTSVVAAPIALPWGIDLTPSMDSSVSYDDNVTNSADDAIESWLTTVSPALEFATDNEIDFYSLRLSSESGKYLNSQRDDYVDYRAEASARVELTSGTSVSMNGSWIRGHEDRGTGFSEGIGNELDGPDEFIDRDLRTGIEYRPENNPLVFELSLGTDSRVYDILLDQAGRDRTSEFGSFSAGYRIGARTTLITQVDYSNIDFAFQVAEGPTDSARGLDNRETDYLAGIEWSSAKTDFSLRVGERHKDFDHSGRANFVGPTWQLNMSWSPLSYSTISLSSQRSTDEPRGLSDFIDARTNSITWNHAWSRRFSTSLSHADRRNDHYGIEQQDHNQTSGLTVNYQARPGLSFSAGFTHQNQESTLDRMNFNKNVSFIGLTLTM
ncbi:outer membrane beta-barrel protein [Microbulbifer elongatus]|uniref:outer membrane beta-barrel protein n=1 Tax=Microbulbifer elongatus TaxID=86173 RepID=UPI001CFC60CF|nr:outer membrane beta-barrel protein [Microbulbifer elongatus]